MQTELTVEAHHRHAPELKPRPFQDISILALGLLS